MATKTLEKNSLLRYFEIYKDKFFKIILLNMFIFTYVTVMILLSFAISSLFDSFKINNWFSVMCSFLPCVSAGPLIGAVTKVCRDFVREVPGFFGDDLKKALKDNWKQCLAISTIQYFVIWILLIAGNYYYSGLDQGFFFTIGLGITIFTSLALLFISYYIYMMAVTLKLKLKEIIKNASILSMLCIGKNLLLTLILGFWVILFAAIVFETATSNNAFLWGITIVLFMALFFGFIIFTTSFMTFPQIRKYIIDPYYEEHPEETSKSINNKTIVNEFNDTEKSSLPEFVYHNGKMVHRSALEEDSVFEDKND